MQITTLGKHGVELNEYKGELSLIATYEATNGTHYAQWGKTKIGKDKATGEARYSEKDRPVKVILGDKNTATGVLVAILKAITNEDYAPTAF